MQAPPNFLMALMQAAWVLAPDAIFQGQYKRQTEGWPESWEHIYSTLSDDGPFHGILGFSQARLNQVCIELHQVSDCPSA